MSNWIIPPPHPCKNPPVIFLCSWNVIQTSHLIPKTLSSLAPVSLSPTSSCFLSPLVYYTAAKTLGFLPWDFGPCIFQDLIIRHYFWSYYSFHFLNNMSIENNILHLFSDLSPIPDCKFHRGRDFIVLSTVFSTVLGTYLSCHKRLLNEWMDGLGGRKGSESRPH